MKYYIVHVGVDNFIVDFIGLRQLDQIVFIGNSEIECQLYASQNKPEVNPVIGGTNDRPTNRSRQTA